MLLLVAGLGGLLYGIDVGIIAGALPYMEATSGLNAGQLSFIVAAVLLGSVISTLFAGMLSDLLGRKSMMIVSGVLFGASIPMIALAQGFGPLVMGRLLQGISAGLIGVTVPLYLAECLGASSRGKGTGIFQWLLTLGIVVAAVIGFYFSIKVEEVEKLHDAAKIFAFKDNAWRSIFWMSLPPGILFILGGFMVSESPRWLFRRGKEEAARTARKFLLSLGSAGIIVALLCVGSVFNKTEKLRVDCREAVQQQVNPVEQSAVIPYNETAASALLATAGDAGKAIAGLPTTIAAVFLPTVGRFGYSTMFFAFAGFTVIYFITAFFFLPETKGRTLEEIGEHFEGKR